jgi:Tol biopolymer transport system component
VNHVPEGLSIVRSDGTDRLDLTTGSDSNASWSPGGDELVFHRSEPQQPSFLYRIKTDGSGSAVRIDLPEEVLAAYEPSWSPQGNRLVFSCIVDGPPDLCVLDLDTGDWARVAVVHDGGEALEHPEWSPDGTRIAFRAWRVFDGDPTIAVVDADGTDLARLYTGQAPSWSPDGKRLVYEARLPIFGDAPNSGVGLRIVNVDGSELIVLTLEPLDWEPAWRP